MTHERRTWMPQEKRGYLPGEALLAAKRKALEYARFEVLVGQRTWKEAAGDLGASDRTLRAWRRREKKDGVLVKTVGRPRRLVPAGGRRDVLRFLNARGPSIGLEALWERFDGLTRSLLRETLATYRDHYRRTHPRVVWELRWKVPGAVWAMDHTKAPRAWGGGDILAVRELALGRKLVWAAVGDVGAEEVLRMLKGVFDREPLPLVLKTDGGAAFRSKLVLGYLEERGVTLLLSPPRRPQYNGSIEAQVRWMKSLTRDVAERSGGPRGEWTPETLERARVMANEERSRTAQASGERIPWEELRRAFKATVAREIELSAREALYGEEVPARIETTLRRLAIERALVAHEILQVRRREIPLPRKLLFAA